MSVRADFNSVEAADEAFYGSGDGSGDGDGDGDDSSTSWGAIDSKATLGHGFALLFQKSTDGSRTRWFITRGTESGEIEAIQASGTTTTVPADSPIDEVPNFDSENAAREAYQAWADENGGDESGDGSDDSGNTEWTKWRRVREVAPWFIFGRSSTSGEQVQFVVAGKAQDGTPVYLMENGSVGTEPHVFGTFAKVKSALQAYSTKAENGEIPEHLIPTGTAPSADTVRTATVNTGGGSSGTSGGLSGVVDTLSERPILVGAVGVAGAYLLSQRSEYE